MPHNECQTLPTWLWVWLVLYVYIIPNHLKQWQEYFRNFSHNREILFSNTGTHISDLLLLTGIPELIPYIVLFSGTLTVAVPQLRRYYLERKYCLNEDYKRIPAIVEIEQFLKKYVPDIKIKANFTRFRDENIFIYPLGYRKTAIAISSKLIKTWRADRAGTEAMLLHEIGHYRNGDALILGAGSFFENVVKHSLSIAVLYIMPWILVTAYLTIYLFYDWLTSLFLVLDTMKNNGIPNSELLAYSLERFKFLFNSQINQLFLVKLPSMIMGLISIFFATLSVFVLPIIGIWCEELNADRFMLMSKRDQLETSIKALEKLEEKKTLKSWLLSQISHPPKRLRYWMALHSCEEKSLLLFLFLFPLAYIIQQFILLIKALSSYTTDYLTGYLSVQQISEKIINSLVTAMHKSSVIWLSFAILLLLWPLIAVYWVKFFSGLHETYNWENYKGYILSAVVLVFSSIYCYTL